MNGHDEELLGNDLLELADQGLTLVVGIFFMHNGSEGIDGLIIQEDLELNQTTGTIFEKMVVHGCIAAGAGLE